MGVFGAWGIANCALVAGLAIFLHKAESVGALAYPASILLCLMCLLGPLSALGSSSDADLQSHFAYNLHEIESCVNWPNIAAVGVWLFSAGVVLTCTVRSRKAVSALPDAGRPPVQMAAPFREVPIGACSSCMVLRV